MWTAMWCQYVSISNMKKVLAIMVLMMFALALPMQASSKSGDGKDDEGGMNLQEIISSTSATLTAGKFLSHTSTAFRCL